VYDPGTQLFGDLLRAIGGAVVRDDNLAGDAHSVK
jgi:hypothetical protein